jgi:hypothetical protein
VAVIHHRAATVPVISPVVANKREAIRLRTAMMQVAVVVKMLQLGFNVASIAAKRRNKGNPWFMRGALFRSGGRAAAC